MFVSHEVTVPTAYDAACARLTDLVGRSSLAGVSNGAYEAGAQVLVRVGPFGARPGLSKLVRVRVMDPVRHATTLTISMRWEATGRTGELFPVLDADLLLMPDGQAGSRLRLVGSYRPPLGPAGAALDRAIMGRLAAATIEALLDDLATALTDPTPNPQSATDIAKPWQPVAEPGTA
jgi:hypothetical protein